MTTFFDRPTMPTNLLTVAEWRRFASAVLPRSISWEAAARYWAERKGGAIVLRADDRLVVFTKRDNGKVHRRTYKPGSWQWARS